MHMRSIIREEGIYDGFVHTKIYTNFLVTLLRMRIDAAEQQDYE